jgi:hypothetical protein
LEGKGRGREGKVKGKGGGGEQRGGEKSASILGFIFPMNIYSLAGCCTMACSLLNIPYTLWGQLPIICIKID